MCCCLTGRLRKGGCGEKAQSVHVVTVQKDLPANFATKKSTNRPNKKVPIAQQLGSQKEREQSLQNSENSMFLGSQTKTSYQLLQISVVSIFWVRKKKGTNRCNFFFSIFWVNASRSYVEALPTVLPDGAFQYFVGRYI